MMTYTNTLYLMTVVLFIFVGADEACLMNVLIWLKLPGCFSEKSCPTSQPDKVEGMLLETFRGCLEGLGNNTVSAGLLKSRSVCGAYSKQMNGRSEEEGLFHPWFHASISFSAALIWWDFSVLKMLTSSLSLLFVNVILDKEVYLQNIFVIDYLWAAS